MKKLMILVLVLCFVGSASASSLVLTVTQDVYARASDPDGAQGVGGDKGYMLFSADEAGNDNSFFMFDISAIPAGQTIDSASLKTDVRYDFVSTVNVDIYAVGSDTWDENTLTWNNKPAYGSSLASFAITGNTSGIAQTFNHDITTYVSASYGGSDDLLSFGIDHDGSTGAFIRTKEDTAGPGGTPRDWPMLELTVTYTPEPMTIALLGLGGLFLRRRK